MFLDLDGDIVHFFLDFLIGSSCNFGFLIVAFKITVFMDFFGGDKGFLLRLGEKFLNSRKILAKDKGTYGS